MTETTKRYEEARVNSIEMLEELLKELKSDTAANKSIDWGHVGSMQNNKAEIKEISDRVFGRGEYK